MEKIGFPEGENTHAVPIRMHYLRRHYLLLPSSSTLCVPLFFFFYMELLHSPITLEVKILFFNPLLTLIYSSKNIIKASVRKWKVYNIRGKQLRDAIVGTCLKRITKIWNILFFSKITCKIIEKYHWDNSIIIPFYSYWI